MSVVVPERVIVHPLVLLSVVDHYNRVSKETKKRTVGVLLGQWIGNTVNVANSFAVPFEEDEKNASVWFLDHNYVENMMQMFKKVAAKEIMVGWYHSGPKLRSSDLAINALFQKYITNPVLVVVNVQPQESLPTSAYFAMEEIHEDGTAATHTFLHLASAIEAEEAEEIGVEHLLRDVTDQFLGGRSLDVQVADSLRSLIGLAERLREIEGYLAKVLEKKLPVNQQILSHLQDIVNLLPDLSDPETIRSFQIKTNDNMVVIYISSLVRAILALHQLINNKLENRKLELQETVVKETA